MVRVRLTVPIRCGQSRLPAARRGLGEQLAREPLDSVIAWARCLRLGSSVLRAIATSMAAGSGDQCMSGGILPLPDEKPRDEVVVDE